MKRYTYYSKAHAPYFNLSELLFFPVAPLFAGAVLSYIALYLGGLAPAIVVMAVISVVGSILFLGAKNFSPNGNNTRRKESIEEMLLPFLAIMGTQLVVNIGGYILVTYQKTGVFYTWYFLGWLFVVLGIPALYFIAQELKYARLVSFQQKHFIPIHITVTHDAELQVYIKKTIFLNTQKKLASDATTNDYAVLPYQEQLLSMSLEDRNRYYYGRTFSETVYIPQNTNRIQIAWYSATENLHYENEFDFPFPQIILENDEASSHKSRHTRPITLAIRENGRVELYSRDGFIVAPTIIKALPNNETQDGSNPYRLPQNNTVKQEDLPAILERVKRRTLLTDFVCNWQLTGSGLDRHNLVVETVQVHEDFGRNIDPNLFVKRPLPIQMTFSYKNYSWVSFHIDAAKLYEQLEHAHLTKADITFDITLDIEKGDASLLVKSGAIQLPFTAFEKNIVSQSLETVKELFQKKKAEKEKNDFLKRILELFQQKAYDEAQALCTSTLQKYPNYTLVYFYEARLVWYTQGYEASYAQEAYFVEKTKYSPFTLARIYNHYGCLLDEEKRYPESLSYFEKAAAAYPEEAMYQANIAEIHYRMNNLEQALHYAEECASREYTSDIISEILALRKAR